MGSKARRSRQPRSGSALRRPKPRGRSEPKGEGTDSIALNVAIVFLLPFSAQKSLVKSPNSLTHYQSTTSAWRISSTPTAILDIDQKTPSPGHPPGLTY